MEKQLNIKKTKENKQQKLLLAFSGELTMLRIEEIRKTILVTFSGFDICEADLRKVSDFDFSFIQVLLALKKAVIQAGKTFKTNIDGWSEEQKNLLAHAGLSELLTS